MRSRRLGTGQVGRYRRYTGQQQGSRESATTKLDNTPRENKNQHLLKMCSFLVATGKFVSVTINYFRVGHTHSLVDQRLGVLVGKLARAAVLQNPQDSALWVPQRVWGARGNGKGTRGLPRRPKEFKEYLEQHCKGAGGRQAKVEIINGLYNFVDHFDNMGIKVSGLAATHWEPATNHSWRIMRRVDLPKLDQLDLAAQVPSCFEEPEHALDAILLAKQWVSSEVRPQT